MPKRPYLIENRLADVLALIQVLSLDKHRHRSEKGLEQELQGKPKSANNWKIIAQEHPEFFRVDSSREHNISLLARHVIEVNDKGKSDLSSDLINTLIKIAIEIHDRQNEKSDRWKVWLPLLVALITVLSSFYIQYSNNENEKFLKHYEVELKPKQEGYTNFMKAISQSYFAAQRNDFQQMTQSLDQAENSFYIIERFLSTDEREDIWENFNQFSNLCYSMLENNSFQKNQITTYDSFLMYKTYFRKMFYQSLYTLGKKEVIGLEISKRNR